MKCLYLYNPNSGKGKYKNKKDYIINRLKEKFELVDYLETKSKDDEINTLLEKGSNYDAIIFSGGDGTVNDVVNTVMKLDNQPILGYLPSGTCNDFARSLKIGKKLDDALDIIINGRVNTYDIFKVNDRYGVYVCATGIFTSASFATGQVKKRKLGKLAYYLHSFGEIFTAKAYKTNVEVNNEKVELNSVLMLIINSVSVAGYKFNKGVDLHDGQAELVAITQKGNRLSFKALMIICKMFLFGIKSVKKYKSVKYYKNANFAVEFIDKKEVNIDGENSGTYDFNFTTCKDKLKIYTN